ncbi:hypothetical protein AVEN_61793-1 [Araneus ventricosus]|uniref:Uncharacterized protein n=1 Tax=Araneus ventricosus TaxID=182803 RepID=A0A4Y2PYT9_ARAVE|nr:hypothetical protein AVEN_61793-1 [Araneus ventricosus]
MIEATPQHLTVVALVCDSCRRPDFCIGGDEGRTITQRSDPIHIKKRLEKEDLRYTSHNLKQVQLYLPHNLCLFLPHIVHKSTQSIYVLKLSIPSCTKALQCTPVRIHNFLVSHPILIIFGLTKLFAGPVVAPSKEFSGEEVTHCLMTNAYCNYLMRPVHQANNTSLCPAINICSSNYC